MNEKKTIRKQVNQLKWINRIAKITVIKRLDERRKRVFDHRVYSIRALKFNWNQVKWSAAK